ncbi:hypothetical protein ACIF6H_32465 [Streptomyces microflavus]|uniref:hypothetical protein n=1 Tax=Streptomyces microflavus TaxID=1919 RepID=UPI0037CE0324
MRDDQPILALTTAQMDQEARDALIALLRAGESLDQAAEQCGLDLQHVLDSVPYDPQLAIVLVGRDPYTPQERQIAQRGVFLGQLSLGVRVADAARAAGVTTSQVRKWADADPHFGRAYQAVVRYTKEFAVSRRSRANLVPERATKLFALLETGRYSVAGASVEIGISEGVVYARRKRDKAFAARLQQAQERGQATREAAEEGA